MLPITSYRSRCLRYQVALKEITCRGLRKLGHLEAMQEFIFNISHFSLSEPYGRHHDNMEKESCSKFDNYEVANGDAPEEGNMNPMIIEKRLNLLTSRDAIDKFWGCCCRCIARTMSMESTIN